MATRTLVCIAGPVLTVVVACSSPGPTHTAAEKQAWFDWTDFFVVAVCKHDDACGVPTGAACEESGFAAAGHAQCDTGVALYLANRAELDRCVASYPTSCSIEPDQACPPLKGVDFETICK